MNTAEKEMQFIISDCPWDLGSMIRIGIKNTDGSHSIASFKFERIEPGQVFNDNQALNVNNHQLQGLMDELWRHGVRPSNGEGNVGQIGAIKQHLKDMRVIAFSNLKISSDRIKGYDTK